MKLTQKQTQAIDILESKNGISHLLYGGSAGSGKSFLGCYWILKICIKYPGSRCFIGRKTRMDLMKSTFITFKKVCYIQNISENVNYKHNYQSNETLFKNGSSILWEPLDFRPSDPEFQRFGSIELTAVFIDEAGEIAQRCYDILATRIRHQLINNEQKMLLTCNPSKNFLYKNFYLPWKKGNLDDYKIFIPALPSDNYPADHPYISGLKKLKGIDRERLLHGNWDYEENQDCIFDQQSIFNLFTNIIEFDSKAAKYISADIAGTGSDRAVVILWHGLTAKEIYISGKCTQEEIKNVINSIKMKYSIGNSNIIIDADGIGIGIAELAFKGCVKFNNGSSPILSDNENESSAFNKKFGNLKAQCYYKFAELAKNCKISIMMQNIRFFGDHNLIQAQNEIEEMIQTELSWARRKNPESDNKIYMYPKDKIKEELGRSPDFADALMMRFYFEIDQKTSLFNVFKQGRK